MKKLKLSKETIRTIRVINDVRTVAAGGTTLSQGCRVTWDDSGCGGQQKLR